MDSRSSVPRKESEDKFPAPGVRVVVKCDGFTCLAYRDSKGIWRADKDDSELPEVLEIIFRF